MRNFDCKPYLLFLVLLMSGCGSLLPQTSAGTGSSVLYSGSAGANPDAIAAVPGNQFSPTPSISPVAILYQSSIGFNTNIYPSVDLVFTRMLHDDYETQEVMQQFIEPGFRMLEEKYGLALPRTKLEADASRKRIYFRGKLGPANEVAPANPAIGLLGIAGMSQRFRMVPLVDEAIASFNSLSPRNVDIRILLSIRIEYFDEEKQVWIPAQPDKRGRDRLAHALTADVTHIYRRFLKEKYGVEVISAVKGNANE